MAELPEVSPRIRRLVTELGSPVAIESLLFLRRQRGKSFSAKALAAALHVTRDVESLLERLAGLNVLDVHVRGEIRYSYAPGSPEQEELVAELDEEYTARRLAVLDILDAVSPASAFADAFRFRRRRKPDG